MPSGAQTTSTDIARARSKTAVGGTATAAGFTIVELLVVVVIVGIMAMTVAPSLSEMLSGNRHATAAMDLVRFARRARSAAISSGAAQMMRFQPAGSGGLGTIERYAGMNNRCLQTPWAIAIARGPNRALGFDMAEYNPGASPSTDDSAQQIIKMVAETPVGTAFNAAELRLCYQPDGQVYTMVSGGVWQPQSDDVEFIISRSVQGEAHGTDRKVLFPVGGNARLE